MFLKDHSTVSRTAYRDKKGNERGVGRQMFKEREDGNLDSGLAQNFHIMKKIKAENYGIIYKAS